MKKRLSFSIIAVLCAALLLYGLNVLAAPSAGATSTSVSGTLKALDQNGSTVTVSTDSGEQTVPLAKSVWVFRSGQKAQLSDLKPGDQVELILNSKKQAAYVKAATATANQAAPAAAQQQSAASAAPSSAATEPAPSAPADGSNSTAPAAGSNSKTPAAGSTANPAAPQAGGVYPGLEGLDLQINGSHFKLEIKQNKEDDGAKYELSLKPDGGGMVHLKGEAAAEWIRELLSAVDLKSAGADQQLLQEIASHYGIDASKLHVKMNAQWSAVQQDQEEVNKAPAPGTAVQGNIVTQPAPQPVLKQNQQGDDDDHGENAKHRENGKQKGHGEKHGKHGEEDD